MPEVLRRNRDASVSLDELFVRINGQQHYLWCAVDQVQFRMSVRYPNGEVRMMACAFADRDGLDHYVDRWLPTFSGKEKSL
jgi:hypothetical protein